MTLTKTRPQTSARTRRSTFGLAVAALALATTLSACSGDELDNTTCGELKDMSADELFDLIAEVAEDDGSDEAKEAAAQFDAVPEDQRETVAQAFTEGICTDEEDDTKLKDTEFGSNG